MGPFRTKRAALFTQHHGQGNPHIQTVNDAERIARKYAKAGALDRDGKAVRTVM